MNTKNLQQLPSIYEFKQQAKELKKSQNFEKLGHAQNALAKAYGYKDYRSIKSVLKTDDSQSNTQSQIITTSELMKMMQKQIYSKNKSTVKFKEEHYYKNQKNIVEGIAIDPILPDDFWSTAHQDREKIELDEWWGKPFILTQGYHEESYEEYYLRMKSDKINCEIETENEFYKRLEKQKNNWYEAWPSGIRYDVYVLDGMAWDRPTGKGKFGSLEESLKKSNDIKW
ncbi:hypothetical protein N3114_12545 (plasmid) [Aliarcobacter butzleri]|uniref:Uncharacterized protein n=1 Tax=Arcobacter porcinus TaxID=1935204 RepID=A0ABX2YEA6_9BACT|nr:MULTISPECIES: hypothetical protein [Arcobacteraceae]OCL89600.1 hypothetical protein AAX28_02012 [Arcobacter porcinus]UWY61375.1 hypothetical protein N3115_11300 [Aliarcobacter butzleri]UXC30673.1 hypothetical protein N3114_12545 [Aliarcobacter butzleri]